MRRTILVRAGLIAVIVIAVFIIDSKLYYYGKNDWGLHDKLPFKITPRYWGHDYGNVGFVLEQDDEALVANGIIYWDYPNISINEILKYGFNKEKLVALIKDSLGKEYYVICEKPVDISKRDFRFILISKKDFIPKDNLNG